MSETKPLRTDIASAQALTLPAMVGYQDGSVVSRVILKRDSGNITLFAFDEGQGLTEHTSPYEALVQIIEGEAEITISGTPIAAKAGDVVLLPA